VSLLEQRFSSTCVIPGDRGRIQAHPFRLQFIHPQNAAPQLALDRLPGFGLAQPPEQQRQTIIGEVHLRHLHPGHPLDRLLRLSHPGLYRLFARIVLAQDMRQPYRRNPAPTQALVQPVTNQMIVNDGWQAQPMHHFQAVVERLNL
jgi:hypothetical protein